MIMLSKGPKPQILQQKAEAWTQDLISAVAEHDPDKVKTVTKRYNHPEVKAALKAETKGKCAYCEAYVTGVSHGDIEHVTPKSRDRARTFDWSNLTFSCQICNQNKSDKEGIIDPYEEDPDEHLFFVGAFAKGKSNDGIKTVIELKLNRASLIESRNREIERYANEIEKVFLIEDAHVKKLLFQTMIDSLDTGHPEFIAACRVVLQTHKPTEP